MLNLAVVTADGSSRELQLSLQRTMLVGAVEQWTPSASFDPATWPDVVLLDLSRNPESCLAFAAHLQRLHPNLCMIGCAGAQPGPDMLLKAMQCGMRDFLAKPIQADALSETLARLMPEREQIGHSAAGKVIVVMGTKGGVGTSTIAVNLAVQLKRAAEKDVLLLDFARPLADDCLLLDLQPSFSIRDAVDNAERMDGHFLAGLVSHHKSGLDVLAGSSSPDDWQHIAISDLSRVLRVARSQYDFIVMDFGPLYSTEWNTLLAGAEILLVSEANVSGLYKLQRYVSSLTSGIERCEIHPVINRWHRRDEEAVRAVEKTLNQKVFARVPNDFAQVSQAASMGVPLSKNQKDSLASRFREMACQLAEVTTGPGDRHGSPGRFSLHFLSSPRTCQSGS